MIPAVCALINSLGGSCGALIVDVSLGVDCDAVDFGSNDGIDLADLVEAAWQDNAQTVKVLVTPGTEVILDRPVVVPTLDLAGTNVFSVVIGVANEQQCDSGLLLPLSVNPNPSTGVTIVHPDDEDAFVVDGTLVVLRGVDVVDDAASGSGTIAMSTTP